MTTRLLMPLLTLAFACTGSNTDKTNPPEPIKPEPPKPEVVKADPWALPPAPPSSVYSGPLFAMSHAYPSTPVAPPADPPWRKASGGGLITMANAGAYTQALKDYVAADMKVLLYDFFP